MQATIPIPKPNERCEEFCIRAHRELMPTLPNVEERNQAVWGAWDMRYGSFQKERYSAQMRFAGWRSIPDVCHYTEHTTTTKQGPLEVGPNEIAAICRNMNRRTKLGLNPPLINKHTPDRSQPNPMDKEPYIVGYAGNYRIGMIDDGEKQRFSIFGDEYHKPEHLAELNDKPRRSVELMRYKDSARNFFDPIACLGAESPRIEMPPAYYSVEHDDAGLEVVRYSIAVPVAAGSSNTFIKQFGDKERMQATAEPNVQTENSQMLQPEDLNQITDAVKNILAPYLPMLDAMAAGQNPGMQQPGAMPGQPGMPGQQQPGGDELQLAGQAAPPAPGPMPEPVKNGMGGMMPAAKPNPFTPGSPNPMKYSEDENEESETVKYSQLEAAHKSLIAEHGSLKARLGKLEAERTDAIRSHRLAELANRFEGIVDFDEEAGKVLYSAGSEMSDEDFEDHLEMIERYAAKAAPPVHIAPGGEVEGEEGDDDVPVTLERYSARTQKMVVDRMTANPVKYSSYEEAEMEVCRELGIVK
jgi:hypothetical protein